VLTRGEGGIKTGDEGEDRTTGGGWGVGGAGKTTLLSISCKISSSCGLALDTDLMA